MESEKEMQEVLAQLLRKEYDVRVECDLGKGRMDIYIPPSTIIECKVSDAEHGIGQLFRYEQAVNNARLILAVPIWINDLKTLRASCIRGDIELWIVDTANRNLVEFSELQHQVISFMNPRGLLAKVGDSKPRKVKVTNEVSTHPKPVF